MMISVLNVNISMNKRANTPNVLATVNLLKVLTTDKYKHLADTCSQIEDKKEKQAFKLNNVPVILIGGIFKGSRAANNLQQHSGLICLDLDGVQDIETLKDGVCKLPFVAYCGKSVSGTGIFVIVPIPTSTADEHAQRYAALEDYFIKHFGISGTVDPAPKSVAAARYVSYDNEAYFNHNASVFDSLPTEQPKPQNKHYNKPQKHISSDLDRVWDMVDMVQDRKIDFAPEYNDYLQIALSLSTLGEAGREAYHAVCQYSTKYSYQDADKQFTNAIRTSNGRVTLASFFGYCKDFGLLEKKSTAVWQAFKPKAKGFTLEGFKKHCNELAAVQYDYPIIWDEPPERNEINDYWRAIILFENLEAAVLAKDHIKVNKAIDSLYLLYGEESDLPIDLMRQYAPTALRYLN